MYYIYIRNYTVFKKFKPYKLYGSYESADKALKAVSKFSRYDDIIIKHNDKEISYIDLVEATADNNILTGEKLIERINNTKYKMPNNDGITNIYPELNNLCYKVTTQDNKDVIMTIYVKDKLTFVLENPKKFNDLINKNDMFKFEFFSLKSVRKLINQKILSKDDIYRSLMLIFDKSIEDSLILITEVN